MTPKGPHLALSIDDFETKADSLDEERIHFPPLTVEPVEGIDLAPVRTARPRSPRKVPPAPVSPPAKRRRA